jgi:hypothetical protein
MSRPVEKCFLLLQVAIECRMRKEKGRIDAAIDDGLLE